MELTIYNGDALEVLRGLPANSINCCVTSPPYYGLRNYGVEGQIGLEESPEAYIERLVCVFKEVKRVLREDGTLWVNLGDSYAGSGGAGSQFGQLKKEGFNLYKQKSLPKNCKPKDLIGIPWMLAFALRADGWYLRQDIIWHKPNPMPESVKDRCTSAHEYIFMLSKSAKYYFDSDAIAEPVAHGNNTTKAGNLDYTRQSGRNDGGVDGKSCKLRVHHEHRNKRSVWTVASQPYSGAHFAVFPPKLIAPCILAGCPKGGMVLDPFGGSGTTAMVARQYGRKAVLIELNPEYTDLIRERNSQGYLPL